MPLTFVDAFDCGMHPPLVPLNCVHLSWQRALLAAIERDAFPCLITEDDIEMTRVRLPLYTSRAGVARFTNGRRVYRARVQPQLQFQRPL